MQKCLGEILNEENDSRPINETMANKEANSNTIPLTKFLEPVSNDISKCICGHLLILYTYLFMNIQVYVLMLQNNLLNINKY